MSSEIRDIRRKFRGDLHSRLGEPASVTVTGACVLQGITVRVHDKLREVGDIKGTSLEFAVLQENTPEIVFFLEQFTDCNPSFVESGFTSFRDVLARNTLIRLEDEDGIAFGYEIDNIQPIHGVTVNALVTRLSQKKAERLELPCPPLMS